jgi:peptide/nickel transport system substrate-binding protein
VTKALAATLFAALVLIPAAATRGIKEGGTFRAAMAAGSFTTIDPALASSGLQLLAPACGSLIEYPSKPLPEGGRLRPELAEADPVVSRDGKTYAVTIRKDARFSTGSAVTARAFASAIERIRDPAMQSPLAADLQDIRGVIANGRTLTLKLTRRVPDFLSSLKRVCAVSPSLPPDPEGAVAPLASPGPYYVAEYVPGERLVLERNRFYKGQRPHHVDRYVTDLGANVGTLIDDIASGKIDFSPTINLGDRAGELRQRYGVNKPQGQVFVKPANELRLFVLNTSRPLFRNNPKLRQAVNFAVDRKALTRELGPLAGTPTDKYLSPSQAGYIDERLYPLKGPDLRTARKLAKGHTRSGKAVLYTTARPEDVSQAQVLQENLAAIGLKVEIVQFPGRLLFDQLATGAKDFDIGRIAWDHLPDPSWFTGIFDGRTIGQPDNQNWSYFNSPNVNRLFDEASRLTGDARDRAYGKLDVQLSRNAAPAIPIANVNAFTFVSARTGCVVVNPYLDLTAVCLK